jgi:hypothetical protein
MAYHYKESGLDNVFLENGFKIHKTKYGKGVSIENTEELHRVLGTWLIRLPKPLIGAELRFLRLEMELTQTGSPPSSAQQSKTSAAGKRPANAPSQAWPTTTSARSIATTPAVTAACAAWSIV